MYHSVFLDLTSNALLHLYSHVERSKKFIPRDKRNYLLVSYLKPKIKDKKYKPIKSDIKRMIKIGRTKNGLLEMKLVELNQMACDLYNKTSNDTARLYDLLNFLFDEHKISSVLYDKNETIKSDVIYIIKEHIEYGFNDNGDQITPISMMIQSEDAPLLVDIINKHGLFSAKMKEWNKVEFQAHLLLHPLDIEEKDQITYQK